MHKIFAVATTFQGEDLKLVQVYADSKLQAAMQEVIAQGWTLPEDKGFKNLRELTRWLAYECCACMSVIKINVQVHP